MSHEAPVFVHSLFRSGSTYIFDKFRRHGGYTCFQEPFNEALLDARTDRASLIDEGQTKDTRQALRHPELDKPYFQEFYDTHEAWRGVLKEDSLYADSFGDTAGRETVAYLLALSNAAQNRPLFQTCRTSLRLDTLKKAIRGVHIALWRNPWDQWWSMKATDYFNTALRVAVDTASATADRGGLREYLDVPRTESLTVPDAFVFHGRRPQSADASYRTFFAIWLMSMLTADQSADLVVGIDMLSHDESYRQDICNQLDALGVQVADFDDCMSPRYDFSQEDVDFFAPIESDVCDWLADCRNADRSTLERVIGTAREATSIVRSANIDGVRSRLTTLRAENAFAKLMAHVCYENAHLHNEVQNRAEALDQYEGEIRRFEHEAVGLHSEVKKREELVEALQGEASWREHEVKELHQEVEMREAALSVHRNEAELAKAELGRAIECLHLANAEIRSLDAQAKVAGSELANARAEIARLALQREAIHTVQVEIEALRRSTSWRVTSPLRRASILARLGLARLQRFAKPIVEQVARRLKSPVKLAESQTEEMDLSYLPHLVDRHAYEAWASELSSEHQGS